MPSSSNKKQQKKGRKRPRQHQQEDDQQQAYYDRLVHQCHKELHKQAKLTKNFIAQKLIRKIKEETASSSETTGGTNSGSSSALLHQQKLQQVKEYELEWVIQECFRRLGIRQLDPKLQHRLPSTADSLRKNKKDADVADGETFADETTESRGEHDNEEEDEKHETASAREALPPAPNGESDDNNTSSTTAASCSWIRERILQHKRMVTALEHWNEQVTEYRRWCLRQQDRAEGVMTATNKKSKSQKTKQKKVDDDDDNALIASSANSIFVTLGGAGADGKDDDETFKRNAADGAAAERNYYGPAAGDGVDVKKNRMGQRARRAKAQAMEARKVGRAIRPEESLNWRPAKKQQQQQQRMDSNRNHGGGEDRSRQRPPPTEDPQNLHPSWKARKEQKEGIVAFQGKKITFD